MVQPTVYEQYMLELINRARLNPLGEANLFGIGLNEGLNPNTISASAKQPLAFNLLLIDSSLLHSQWMLETDTFSHTGEGGSSARQRMEAAGYQFTGSWTWGENLGFKGTTGTIDLAGFTADVHQGLFESPGHRTNILNGNFREIGIGIATGDFDGFNSLMATQNFAKSGSDVFLTGVAFDDSVIDDDFYTIGEGLGGIEVTAVRQSDNSSFSTTTMDAGGYQMALDPGTYEVTFSNNNQIIGNASQITIGSENIKLDLDTNSLPVNETPIAQIMGEVGTISNLDHNIQTIQLNNSYVNPVVFALTLSYNGADTAIARITDIQDDNFSIYVQEAEYKDGIHARESLSYIVLEAGTWELEDGTMLEVGTLDTDSITTSQWESIDFASDFQQTPAILSQVQTYNDSEFVHTRQNASTVDGFQLAMEEEEVLRSTGHGTETVGWFAMETGSGSWDGLGYQVGRTGKRIDHTWDEINFREEIEEVPSLFASISSYYGSDPAELRYRNLSSSKVEIHVEEDQSFDIEVDHAREIVDFLAISGSGDLSAIAHQPMTS